MARLSHVGHIGNLAESATDEGSDRSDSSLGADRYLVGQRSYLYPALGLAGLRGRAITSSVCGVAPEQL